MKTKTTATTTLSSPLRYGVLAVTAAMAVGATQAQASSKKIGDLEIYQAAEGGKVTITMMLDTSGSMSYDAVGNDACDLPENQQNTTVERYEENSGTSPSYDRIGCKITERRYYYREVCEAIVCLIVRPTWYACGNGNNGSTDYRECNVALTTRPNTKGLSEAEGYYYKNISTKKPYFDRLTRLKDAIFRLMDEKDSKDNYVLDSKKVAIGIGQFSAQSDKNNVYNGADGLSGKILLPAALLTDTQRANIKTAVAALRGSGGTPTANAYSSVGAYMLGESNRYDNDTTSGFDKSVPSSKSGGKYISPLNSNSQCDGQGIYFLTDGKPNSSKDPEKLMRKALGTKSDSFNMSNTLPPSNDPKGRMPEVGAFARALRIADNNPKNLSIRTAVVGFGSDFNVDNYINIKQELRVPELDKKTSMPVKDARGNYQYTEDKIATYFDCSKITDRDAKNACNWGAKSHPSLPGVGGYGEGGFYSAQSTEDVIDSIKTFVNDLNQTLPATPSGTITVPDDPYRADSQLAYAYYPMVEAKVSDAVPIWPGNVKKYTLNAGTLVGKNNKALFTDASGALVPTTQDLWSAKNEGDKNTNVQSGGYYSQLPAPNASEIDNIRTLYIENANSLVKFGVNSSGQITLNDNAASNSNTLTDAIYTPVMIKRLVNFLGFNDFREPNPNETTTNYLKDLSLDIKTASGGKQVGATIHSAPTAVSYAANLDDDGRVGATRDDYVLFGSMDGALHLVSTDSGEEKFAFIPKVVLQNQPNSINNDTTGATAGAPNAGVDAPWLVTADYKYDLTSKKVNIDTDSNKGVFAYGGFRLGGNGLYGLDLSRYDAPRRLFSILPPTSPSAVGFGRMGQIWSKPVKARVRLSESDKGTDVLIFGGGYDTCYEDESYYVGSTTSTMTNQAGQRCNRTTNPDAIGNAVYMINAKTGALLWSASNANNTVGSSSVTNAYMKNSIVGGVTVLDRDNDGFMDHIYFADLGGQLFRADFIAKDGEQTLENNRKIKVKYLDLATASNARVTRLLAPANEKQYQLRFYERPVVSFYRNNDSKNLFAMVNLISGDRSSPLSKIRTQLSNSDRVYGIVDSDITRPNTEFNTASNLKVKDLTDANLVALPTAMGAQPSGGYTEAQRKGAIAPMQSGSKRGWYYLLTRFDGYNNVRYNKGVGKSEVINSTLYTTVYNPDMTYDDSGDDCSAKIVGGSERELYCLPYGICLKDPAEQTNNSINGTGGFMRAGKGIQELTLGPYSSERNNQRLLIGTLSLPDRAIGRVNFGRDSAKDGSGINSAQKGLTLAGGDGGAITQEGGDGSAKDTLIETRWMLTPKTWYQVSK